MVFRTVFNIYPGDEIFVNYGENYWDDKRNSKVRQSGTIRVSLSTKSTQKKY